MSLFAYKEGFSLFHLIGVASGTFQTFLACYGLFPVVPLFTSDEITNILTCNFTINQLLKRSVRVFIKQDSFFELQSRAIFTTKWGNNYNVVHYKRQMKETKEIDFGSLMLHSPLICLATDSLPLGILEKLNHNQRRNIILPS